MKKVIVKSVVITLCLLLVSVAISIAVITAYFPMTIANVAFKVDAKQSCVTYTEKAYENNQSIDTLAILTERCIWANDDEKTVIYAEKFIAHEKFDNYALSKDAGYAYYIASEYVIALYELGYKEKSVETAFQLSNGFKTVGPLHRLIAISAKANDIEVLTAIKTKLVPYSTDEYANYLISVIEGVIG